MTFDKFNETDTKRYMKTYAYAFELCNINCLDSINEVSSVCDREIKRMRSQVEELLFKIELLEGRKAEIDKIAEDIKSEDNRIVIEIKESKKTGKHGNYSLSIHFQKITETGKIASYDYVSIPFKERVKGRDSILLDYINSHNVDEIITNVDISKFLKEHNIENIKITNI